MPARKEGHVTELETYYWVSSDVSKFLEKYKNIHYDVTRKFRKISSQFDDLHKLYKRNDGNVVKKDLKRETGGRYIFQKTLACYIVRKLNLSEKSMIERLRDILNSVYDDRNRHVDTELEKAREELEKIVTEKDAYFNKELTRDISYGSWAELLNTKCNFICGESGNCKERCTPTILLELFEIVKSCKVKNENVMVYSLAEIEEICRCLIQLLPLGWSEADYIKRWNSLEGKAPSIVQGSMENTEENKPEYTQTIFSSVKRLQYGNADDIAEKEWFGIF